MTLFRTELFLELQNPLSEKVRPVWQLYYIFRTRELEFGQTSSWERTCMSTFFPTKHPHTSFFFLHLGLLA